MNIAISSSLTHEALRVPRQHLAVDWDILLVAENEDQIGFGLLKHREQLGELCLVSDPREISFRVVALPQQVAHTGSHFILEWQIIIIYNFMNKQWFRCIYIV